MQALKRILLAVYKAVGNRIAGGRKRIGSAVNKIMAGMKKSGAYVIAGTANVKKLGQIVNRCVEQVKRIHAIGVRGFLNQVGATGRSVTALALTVVITMGSVVTVTVMAATHTAHIVYDGQKKDVEITSEETDKILQKAGISAGPNDIVLRAEDPDHAGDVLITVKQAFPVEIARDGADFTVTAHYGDTVGQVLASADMVVGPDEEVSSSLIAPVSSGMAITVESLLHIQILADGKTLAAVVSSETVQKALDDAGITLGPDDTVSVPLTAQVQDGMQIKVSRVTYQDATKTESIAYGKVMQKDATMTVGTQKVVTQGKEGTKETVTREKLVDGKVVSGTVVKTTVTVQPADEVIRVGTKAKPVVMSKSAAISTGNAGTFTDEDGKAVAYKKLVSGRCSAYTGGGWTSTGKKAAFGLVAVDPKIIPYGSRLYIASPDGKTVYGYAIAADTGGAAKRGSILADLYYDTRSQCVKFGSRKMNVYVL